MPDTFQDAVECALDLYETDWTSDLSGSPSMSIRAERPVSEDAANLGQPRAWNQCGDQGPVEAPPAADFS